MGNRNEQDLDRQRKLTKRSKKEKETDRPLGEESADRKGREGNRGVAVAEERPIVSSFRMSQACFPRFWIHSFSGGWEAMADADTRHPPPLLPTFSGGEKEFYFGSKRRRRKHRLPFSLSFLFIRLHASNV